MASLAKPQSSPAVNFAPEKSTLRNERHSRRLLYLFFMKSHIQEGRDLRERHSVFVR